MTIDMGFSYKLKSCLLVLFTNVGPIGQCRAQSVLTESCTDMWHNLQNE